MNFSLINRDGVGVHMCASIYTATKKEKRFQGLTTLVSIQSRSFVAMGIIPVMP
jgi:hypothetical protein